nr:imidazoleglycerol-phosphate dehydratase HisB [Maliibacterium massiliense]
MREGRVMRKTRETDITAAINLDGAGAVDLKSGIGFFDHMLELFAKHGLFDVDVLCDGDLSVDGHHSVEDIGIALGQAFAQAVGDKRGIARYGTASVPMDEALAIVTLDISARPLLVLQMEPLSGMVGAFDAQLLEEFLRAFATHAALTLHVQVPYGHNTHHIIEAVFKALGRALRQAVTIDPRVQGVPSSKGVL